jgi:type 1 glutamine amidotransferase
VNDPARGAGNCAADRTQPRRVLVLARAASFVHSSIPLASRTIEALGQKTGAWTTVISYNHRDITAENLAQYDAVFLSSTTGEFLDDANDAPGSETRRKALMDFVRSGKGMAGVHAATDSYHPGGKPGWPDFNTAIGGFFKFHWNYPTLISIKVDDLDNPINAPFMTTNAQGVRAPANIQLIDEVYTFQQDSWSRDRVRTLTSIAYDRMPDNIKAQEPANGKRTDGDYGLSYIRKEGNGRVFVNVLGHHESIYKMRNMNAHLLAGMQYVLGDLKVDDTPVPLKK